LPSWHVCPDPHFLLQPPQCWGFVCVSVQAPSQTTDVAGQTQLPPWQTSPAGHLLLHSPQWLASVAKSTHSEPHRFAGGQTHWPAWQTSAPGQTGSSSMIPSQSLSLPSQTSVMSAWMPLSASLQSSPPQTIGTCPSLSRSRGEKTQIAWTRSQRTSVLQG